MDILSLLWYFVPAYVANMAPVLFRRVPFLDSPVDFGIRVGGVRLLGNHKTWRGLVLGVALGTFVFWLQTQYRLQYELFDYGVVSLWPGFLLSFGALFGDLVKSFFKRRRKIKPGNPWYVVDQIDYVIGALVFSSFIFIPSVQEIAILVVASFFLTVLVNYLGKMLRFRKVAW
ncbi:MAG: CDP-archaeol synthase [Candidatus Nanoarchaeia archaeon]